MSNISHVVVKKTYLTPVSNVSKVAPRSLVAVGPQRTQLITANAFQISLQLD